MTTRIPSDVAEARLNHLIDRARRGALLPAEADQFTTGLRDLVRRLEDTEDDLRRVQQKACHTAEALRRAETEREQLRTLARTHWDTTERVRALHDSLAREDMLASPEDLITRGRAAENIAAALDGWTAPDLDRPQQPTEDEARQLPCSLWLLSNGHAPHWWQPQPGMPDVLCPGAPRKAVATQPQQPTITEA